MSVWICSESSRLEEELGIGIGEIAQLAHLEDSSTFFFLVDYLGLNMPA